MYRVELKLQALDGLAEHLTRQGQGRLSVVVRAVAEEGALRWSHAIKKARLWEGEKQPYIQSLGWEPNGPFEATISADYEYAAEIETGRPRKDLKAMLRTSKRTRRSAKGKTYLIIPFRHNTPSASGQGAHAPQMPRHVYKQAQGLAPSRERSTGRRRSASGHLVPQQRYQWGGRLPAGLVPKKKAHHKSDPYAGMVRFDTSSGRQRASSYLTFRVMHEDSDGWIIQPRPGLFLARGVAGQLNPVFQELVAKAISLK